MKVGSGRKDRPYDLRLATCGLVHYSMDILYRRYFAGDLKLNLVICFWANPTQ